MELGLHISVNWVALRLIEINENKLSLSLSLLPYFLRHKNSSIPFRRNIWKGEIYTFFGKAASTHPIMSLYEAKSLGKYLTQHTYIQAQCCLTFVILDENLYFFILCHTRAFRDLMRQSLFIQKMKQSQFQSFKFMYSSEKWKS